MYVKWDNEKHFFEHKTVFYQNFNVHIPKLFLSVKIISVANSDFANSCQLQKFFSSESIWLQAEDICTCPNPNCYSLIVSKNSIYIHHSYLKTDHAEFPSRTRDNRGQAVSKKKSFRKFDQKSF
jgi:hypothetical protein